MEAVRTREDIGVVAWWKTYCKRLAEGTAMVAMQLARELVYTYWTTVSLCSN